MPDIVTFQERRTDAARGVKNISCVNATAEGRSALTTMVALATPQYALRLCPTKCLTSAR